MVDAPAANAEPTIAGWRQSTKARIDSRRDIRSSDQDNGASVPSVMAKIQQIALSFQKFRISLTFPGAKT